MPENSAGVFLPIAWPPIWHVLGALESENRWLLPLTQNHCHYSWSEDLLMLLEYPY